MADHDAQVADPLARASLDELARYRRVAEDAGAATKALNESLHPKMWDAVEELIDLRMIQHEASTELFVAELARHFPGTAPAILAVWNHVSGAFFDSVGNCCTAPDPAD